MNVTVFIGSLHAKGLEYQPMLPSSEGAVNHGSDSLMPSSLYWSTPRCAHAVVHLLK